MKANLIAGTKVRLLSLFLAGVCALAVAAGNGEGPRGGSEFRADAVSRLSALSTLRFETNHGQAPSGVRYLARSRGHALLLTGRGAVLTAGDPVSGGEPATVSLRFAGGAPDPEIAAESPLRGTVNYLIGRTPEGWRTGIPTFAKVRYRNVYPGIDVVFHGDNQALEYDFVVAPGASVAAIRVAFEGARNLLMSPDGALRVNLGNGTLRQPAPRIYQIVDGERMTIAGGFVVDSDGLVGFEVAAYDAALPLVIDPVLEYSTFLGGSKHDEGLAIAVDAEGSAYVSGTTKSVDFPSTDAFQPARAGKTDAFVVKLSADGEELIYATYIGGGKDDAALGVAVNEAGRAHVAGRTSSRNDFPIMAALQPDFGGGSRDGFVLSLTEDGDALTFSTYFGGEKSDEATGIAVDGLGHVLVAGHTRSRDEFPLESPLQSALGDSHSGGDDDDDDDDDEDGGSGDAFVAKLAPGGAWLVYSTYLGGQNADRAAGIATDGEGSAYIAGHTKSRQGFPLENPLQATLGDAAGNGDEDDDDDDDGDGAGGDAFITKINADGSALVFSTYLGGTKADEATAVAVDRDGGVYVAGFTRSRQGFPLENPFQSTLGDAAGGDDDDDDDDDEEGGGDAFVAKLSPDGASLVYSTYIGGRGHDRANAIGVDVAGNAVITGVTDSDAAGGFPLADPVQADLGGQTDGFILKLGAGGDALLYSTHLGGGKKDAADGVAVDFEGNAYVTGRTRSQDDFPLVNAVQPFASGSGDDAFAAKIRSNRAPFFTSDPVTQARAEDLYTYTATAEDPDGDALHFALALAPEGMSIDADTGELTFTPAVEGEAEVVLEVQDGAGGIDIQSFVIIIESANEPPVIVSTPVTEGIVNVLYEYDVEAEDPDGDVLVYALEGAPTGMNINAQSGLIQWVPDAAGDFSVTVTATDPRDAKASQTYLVSVILDDTPPVITIDSPEDSFETTADTVVIEGAIDEPGEVSIDGANVTLADNFSFVSDPLPLTEGDNTFTIVATDLPQNQSIVILTVVRDTTPPAILVNTPADGEVTNSSSVLVAGSLDEPATLQINGQDATVAEDLSFGFTATLAEGPNTIVLTATDALGNTATESLSVTVDTAPPVLVVTSPAAGLLTSAGTVDVAGSVNETATVTVNGNPATVDGSLNFSFPGLALVEGDNFITVLAEDLAGNTAALTVTVTRDSVAPLINLAEPQDGLLTNQTQIDFSGTLSEAVKELTLNGDPVGVTDLNFTVTRNLAEGPNGFLLTAEDLAGNESTLSLTVTRDSVPPSVVITAPPDGLLTGDPDLTVTGTVSEAVASLIVNGVDAAVAGDLTFSAQVTLVEGANTITATATDFAGNTGTSSVNVTLDNTPPPIPDVNRITRGFPSAGVMAVNGRQGSVEDNGTVLITNTTTGKSVTVLANVDGAFSGSVAGDNADPITVRALDALGNESDAVTLGPAAAPTLTLDPIGDRTVPLGQTLRFTVTASDSDDAPIELQVTPLPLPAGAEFDIGTGAFEFKPVPAQAGDHVFRFIARTDDEEVSETIIVTVPAPDLTAPTRLEGRLLDATSLADGVVIPIVGATVSFLGTGVSGVSDNEGFFSLTDIPPGEQVFAIDAATANPAPGGAPYASFREALTLIPNVINKEDRPFSLPRIAAESLTQVVPTKTTVVNNPTLGITITVPPNNTFNDDGTPFVGQLSISEVPPGLAPAALPDFLEPALLITIQPAGVRFANPVPITFPNTDNLTPGTEADIWSLDPELGEFAIVGVGRVSNDGQRIETISGGIRAADWHAPPPPPPQPPDPDDPDSPPPPDPDKPCPPCPERDGSSMYSLHDGHMSTRFSLPTYRSLEAERTTVFSYRSFRAYPRPTIEINGSVARRSAVPETLSYELEVGGVRQGKEIFVSTAGFNVNAKEPFHNAVVFDASDFATGMYSYRLRMAGNFPGGTRMSTFIENDVMVVNEQDSVFGAGWMLEGLYRLAFNFDGSVTLVAPNGDSTNYRPSSTPDVFDSPSNDYAVFARNPDGSYTHTEKDGIKMHFDADGFITALEDRNSNITAYAYNAQRRLSTITDPVGLVTTFAYSGGKLRTVTDPAGRTSTFDFNAAGDLTRITYPDGTFETFEYDDRHLMVAHTDERNNRYTDRYDAFGRVIDGTLPDGTVRSVNGKTTVGLIDVSNGVGTESNPARISRPDDVAGDYVDGRGNNSKQVLDPHGRPTLEMDEVGRITTHVRDADSNPTQTTRPIGSVVNRTFDDFGNTLTQTEEFNGATITFTYDQFSLITSKTNPRNHTTTIIRDPANGNPLTIVNHLGHTTTLEYDSRGLVTRTLSPNNLETVYTYNAQGLLETKTETPPAGSPGNVRVTQYSHFDTGLLKQMITPDGVVVDYIYDERSYLVSVTDNLGQSMIYTYDENKNVVRAETTNADGSLAILVDGVFDERNRLVETRSPHATTEESITRRVLDENSNLISMVDPNGNASSNTFDPFNRLDSNTHREGGATEYEYDDQDRIVKVTAPNGVVTEYEYDIIGRRIREISADRGILSYTFDLANNVISITEGRGVVTAMTYDELERVATKTYPNTISGKNENVTYTYDECSFGLGKLCARTDESGSYGHEYDAFGNLTASTFTELSGTIYEMSYVYDDGDRVIQATYPSGRVVNYARDGVRRIEEISATVNGTSKILITGVRYRGDNQVIESTYGNQLVDERIYDLQGRLVHQILRDDVGTVVDERTYTYDKNGNVLAIEAMVEDNAYSYDRLDRLTEDAVDTDAPSVFGYDSNSNRVSERLVDGSREDAYIFAQASNRLETRETFVPGATPIEPVPQRELVFNDASRLFRLIENGDLRAEYFYNAEGQRTRKVVHNQDGSTSVTIFHYDHMGYLVTETNEAGEFIRDYIWTESMQLVAQIDDMSGTDEVSYLYSDHLLTNRLATDEFQQVVWRWEGDAFGRTPALELSGVSVNIRFPGQYFDSETGLHYNWQRYYDPALGRYITSDPIGLDGGMNLFLYASANPIIFMDPTGLDCVFLYEEKRTAPYLLDEDIDYFGFEYRNWIIEPIVSGEPPPPYRTRRPGPPIGPSFRIVGYDLRYFGLKTVYQLQQAQEDRRNCYECDVVDEFACLKPELACTDWMRYKKGEQQRVFISRDIVDEFIKSVRY